MPLEDKSSYSYSQTVSCAMGLENRKNSKIAKETPIKKPNKRTTIMCAGRSKKRFFNLKSKDLRGEAVRSNVRLIISIYQVMMCRVVQLWVRLINNQ